MVEARPCRDQLPAPTRTTSTQRSRRSPSATPLWARRSRSRSWRRTSSTRRSPPRFPSWTSAPGSESAAHAGPQLPRGRKRRRRSSTCSVPSPRLTSRSVAEEAVVRSSNERRDTAQANLDFVRTRNSAGVAPELDLKRADRGVRECSPGRDGGGVPAPNCAAVAGDGRRSRAVARRGFELSDDTSPEPPLEQLHGGFFESAERRRGRARQLARQNEPSTRRAPDSTPRSPRPRLNVSPTRPASVSRRTTRSSGPRPGGSTGAPLRRPRPPIAPQRLRASERSAPAGRSRTRSSTTTRPSCVRSRRRKPRAPSANRAPSPRTSHVSVTRPEQPTT